jgi:hypothetical protein
MSRQSEKYIHVKTTVDPEFKVLIDEALTEAQVSLSDFLRSSLIHLVEQRSVPFKLIRSLHKPDIVTRNIARRYVAKTSCKEVEEV